MDKQRRTGGAWVAERVHGFAWRRGAGVLLMAALVGAGCGEATSPTELEMRQSAATSGPCRNVTCTALDQCHSAGTCNPATGVCSNPLKADGVTCNDGNACTTTDTCQAGNCRGNPVTCTALDQCHKAGTCNPATGSCSQPSKPNGTACNDGNACTKNEVCTAGFCGSGSAVTCAAPDQCHLAATCNPTLGCGVPPVKPDGTLCSPASCPAGSAIFTMPGTCSNGSCSGSATRSCSPYLCDGAGSCRTTCTSNADCVAPNTCTNGSCGKKPPGATCTAPEQCAANLFCTDGVCCNSNGCGSCRACNATGVCQNQDGMSCGATDQCHLPGSCSNGTCTNPLKQCPLPDQCHGAGVCNAADGTCTNPAKPNGTVCNDANPCTQTDTCQAGACSGGSPKICTAVDQCHVAGTCNPGTGTCSQPSKPNGTSCNDGNVCTAGDVCTNGSCTGTQTNCNDSSACTTDSCNPQTGCVHTPVSCNDNNACTAESCNPQTGCGHTPVSCNDNNACTADSCDPQSGCNQAPVSCNDNNACTVDSCDPQSGCDHTAVGCDDGNACTADSCAAIVGCTHSAIPRCGYTIEDLGVINGDSEALAVNGVGRVVGVSGSSFSGFYADRNGPLTSIPNPFGDWYIANDVASDGRIALGSAYVGWIYDPATGVTQMPASPFVQTNRTRLVGLNDTGLAVAWADNGGYAQMYVWDSVGGGTALIPGAFNRCIGKISNTGLAVGNSDPGAAAAAFLFDYNTRGVQTVPGFGGETIGYDVDDSGTVVGSSRSGGALRAFLWRPGAATAEDLGTLGGPEAEAFGIGVATDVVGAADNVAGERHAFVWRPSWGMIDLGALPGDVRSVAYGVGPSGVIVGSSGPVGARHAVRWVPMRTPQCTGQADGTLCDDGNACSQTDTCQAGTCVGANPVTCNAVDQSHAAGTCDPGTGSC